MNAIPPPRRLVLTIEVIHDLICPWCHLGLRRLRRALARIEGLEPRFSWHAFLLNPDIPRQGLPFGEYLVRKFSSEDRARRIFAVIEEIGRREGINFHFDRLQRIPSSVDAHRLVRFAARHGRGLEVVEALQAAHFIEGADLGDHATLCRIATASGLPGEAVARFLESGEETDAVHAENIRAHRLGISGVPCFIFAGRYAVSGAQEPDVFARLIDVALTPEETP
jgi:predicted DsbA family dithiol-disulfide isomerase